MIKDRRQEFNLRLYILSVFVGLLAGLFAAMFRIVLFEAYSFRSFIFKHDMSLLFYVGVVLFIWIALLVIDWIKDNVLYIDGSGIPQSRAVIFGRYTFRKPLVKLCSKFLGSISVIGLGLSVGHGGPCAQMGALGATYISNITKSNAIEKRYLTIAGTSAGMAGAFTTPIASTIFIVEEITGWISVKILIPTILACVIAGYCAQLILPLNPFSLVKPVAPDLDIFVIVLLLLILCVISALMGELFNRLLLKTQLYYKTFKISVRLKLLIMSIITFVMGYLFLNLIAGGENELLLQLNNNTGSFFIVFSLTLLLIMFTCLSYSTQLYGSLFYPLIVIGGMIGKSYSLLLISMGVIEPVSSSYFVLIGMALMLVSSIRTPISSLVMVLEMTTHYTIFFPMIFAGGITYMIGQFIGLKHIYHKLYNVMLTMETDKYEEIEFEINYNSVLEGKTVDEVPLFLGCTVVDAMRANGKRERIELRNEKLIPLDIIKVKIPTENYEELFKIYRALANE